MLSWWRRIGEGDEDDYDWGSVTKLESFFADLVVVVVLRPLAIVG